MDCIFGEMLLLNSLVVFKTFGLSDRLGSVNLFFFLFVYVRCKYLTAEHLSSSFSPAGGRSSQAIVDGAMNSLRSLVKERLSGKSGGSGYSKQVEGGTVYIF